MLDEVEQRILGPVDVLEDEHEGLGLRELLRPGARRPRELLAAPLALDGGEDPRGEPEQVSHDLDLARRAELLERLFGGVVVGDARRGLDHLGKGPVRDALAVGQRAAREDRAAVEARDELAREPALPHPGIAVDREKVGTPVALRAFERVRQQLELRVAADERRLEAPHPRRPVDRSDHAPDPDRCAPPLQLERPDVLGLHAARRQPVRAGADEDLARRRGLLEPRGDVDGLAGREGRVAVVGDDLARLDADPGLELEVRDGLHDRERRPDGPLRVVLVRARDPERGHHRVAGELLHRAAVGDDAPGDVLEEARHAPANDLRVIGREELRRLDEIDEEDGRELALYHPKAPTRRCRPSGRAGALPARPSELTGRHDRISSDPSLNCTGGEGRDRAPRPSPKRV